MASRNLFWVGGAAAWDGTAGSKWSLTSGGAAGEAIPTIEDNVTFDSGGGGACTSSGTTTDKCRSLDILTGGNLVHGSATTISVGDGTAGTGNRALRIASGATYTRSNATSSAWKFVSTSATVQTVDSGGKTLGNIEFNGVGGSWQLTSSLTLSGSSGAFVTLTAGTLDTNNQAISTGILSTGAGVRSLILGSSVIGPGGALTQTIYDFTTTTNLTFDAGTSELDSGGTATKTFKTGGLIFNKVALTATTATTIFTGAATMSVLSAASGTTMTLPSTLTTTATTFSINGANLNSSTPGSAATISVASGTINKTGGTITDSTATGGATFNAYACVNGGGNTGWNFLGSMAGIGANLLLGVG